MLLLFQRRYLEPGIRCFYPGDVAEIENEMIARAYIHHGFAVEVEVPQPAAELAERAIAPPVAEHAIPKRRRERRTR